MGLDNGIILYCSDEDYLKFPYPDERDLGCEYKHVAYWRKCWDIRRDIIAGLHYKDEDNSTIDLEDIPRIIRILKPYLNENYWNENDDSIWAYEEMFDHTYEILVNLEYLKKYLKDNPDVKCEFYDSY
jgi:hypothetical protein